MRRGYKTSEGWATFGVLMVGALAALGIVDPDQGASWYDQAAGFVLMLGGLLGYQRARTDAKKED